MNNEATSFGQLVKTHRQATGLTQDELARRVGCASVTLRKIEYGDLRPSVQIAERLAIMLNIHPEERVAFVRLARDVNYRIAEKQNNSIQKLEELGIENLAGQTIRGYVLIQNIGKGGFGAVYQAMQPGVEREVALKVILPKYANNPEFIRRFDLEAQLIARLEHPHIVPFYDYWREPNGAYLVMRLLRGGNLRNLLQDGPLPSEEVLRIVDQIGAALGAAHRAGIIHGNLKSSNILLDEDHNAYLTDFGIAYQNNSSPSQELPLHDVHGAPEYISPEQIRSEAITPQTDIYRLGVTIYEWLTGTLPFHGATPHEIMHHHLNAAIPSLATNRGGLPKALDKVIARSTAKNPAERYTSIEDLLTDFRSALNFEESTPISTEALDVPKPPSISLTPADNPYKGLRSFGELDEADFFGRDAFIQQLIIRLGESGDLSRFLAVIGPSGSGKSSVVKAGLLPAIRRGALPNSENWFVVDVVPGINPLEQLETALLRIAISPPPNLIDYLLRDKHGLLRAVDLCLPEDASVELLIVIDQFEEIFTLVSEETVRSHFLEMLLTAILEEDSRVQIIITLRADFVDRLLNYVDFGELLRQRTEFVLPLTNDELEQAIVRPAERVGLQIEDGVVSAIIHDLNDQPGSLPLLQYALTELFENREANLVTKHGYQAIGGVRGALGRRAEDVFTSLSKSDQALAQQLFLRLITLGEGIEDTRRRVLRAEMESITNTRNMVGFEVAEEMESILATLGRSRLLTFDRDPRSRVPTIEIAHEALIRTWDRLRAWLTENREDLRIQRQLSLASKEWINAKQDLSFLATGTRLTRFETLASESHLVLNGDELAYLSASIAERQHRDLEKTTQQRRFIGALVAALVVTIGLSIFALVQRKEALVQAQIAISRQLAAQALAEVRNPLGNNELAALLAIRSLRIQYDSVADSALVEASDVLPLKEFVGHSDTVRNVAFSPSGKYILTGSLDHTAKLWNVATGEEIFTLSGHSDKILAAGFSPDGKYIVTGSADHTAKIWDALTGQVVTTLNDSDELASAVFSPDSQYVLTTVGGNITGKLWEVKTGHLIQEYSQVELGEGAAFSADGKYISAGSADYTVVIIETATGRTVQVLHGHTNGVKSTAFSADGKLLLSGSIDNTAILWNIASGQPVLFLRGHTNSVYSVAFSPDGKYLLTGSGDHTARLWDASTGQEIRSLRGHLGRVWSVAFSPDGRTILTGSADQTAKLWALTPGHGRILQGHTAEVYDSAFSPDGKYILTSSLDHTAKLWDFATGTAMRSFVGSADLVNSVSFSPDMKWVLTGGEDGIAKVWELATGKGVLTLKGHTGSVYSAVFSPDGKSILTGSQDHTVKLWESATGNELRTYLGHDAEVESVAFSPDGKYFVTGSADNTAKVWEVSTGRVIQTFVGHADSVFAARFSPDGKNILTGSADTTAKLWDIATGKVIRVFNGHTNTIYDVAFSPDGRYAATASADRRAIIWNTNTGGQVRVLSGHTSGIWSVSLSPDGKYVLTGSFDGTARLWNLDYQTFVAKICTQLLRDFTEEERVEAHITDQQPTCSQQNAH